MGRRRAGSVLPIELEVLAAAVLLEDTSDGCYGFKLGETIQRMSKRPIVPTGTLYKALARLQAAGMLTAEWEAPEVAVEAGRPRRKRYSITGAGRAALAAADRVERAAPRPAWGGA